ncbi:MAG: lipocalin-like domain-containing protein [Bacillota bacterium]
MSSQVNPLVGTWRILTFEMRAADGQVALRPLGERPTGYLLYSAEGYMSAAVSAPERTAWSVPDQLLAPEEERAAAISGLMAYSGRYEVVDGAVIHYPEAAHMPNMVGAPQRRFFVIDGDRMTLTSPPFRAGGQPVTVSATWERVVPS